MKTRSVQRALILACVFFLIFAGPVLAVKTHTMVQGDTLWDLSAKFYGDPTLYPIFLECNSISNPRTIPVGKVIVIPSYDEIKKIAAESDSQRRKELISKIQGDADSANAASSGSAKNKPAPTPPTDDPNRQNLYRSDRAINPDDVSFGKMLNKKIDPEAIKQVETGR